MERAASQQQHMGRDIKANRLLYSVSSVCVCFAVLPCATREYILSAFLRQNLAMNNGPSERPDSSWTDSGYFPSSEGLRTIALDSQSKGREFESRNIPFELKKKNMCMPWIARSPSAVGDKLPRRSIGMVNRWINKPFDVRTTKSTEQGGAMVNHWNLVRKAPGSIPGSAILIRVFYGCPKSLQWYGIPIHGGHGGVVVRLLASHLGAPGSIPGCFAPVLSHVGIVPGYKAVRGFLSAMSCFPRLFHSGSAPYSPRFTLIGSQDLDVRSRPNILTHSQKPRTHEHELGGLDLYLHSGEVAPPLYPSKTKINSVHDKYALNFRPLDHVAGNNVTKRRVFGRGTHHHKLVTKLASDCAALRNQDEVASFEVGPVFIFPHQISQEGPQHHHQDCSRNIQWNTITRNIQWNAITRNIQYNATKNETACASIVIIIRKEPHLCSIEEWESPLGASQISPTDGSATTKPLTTTIRLSKNTTISPETINLPTCGITQTQYSFPAHFHSRTLSTWTLILNMNHHIIMPLFLPEPNQILVPFISAWAGHVLPARFEEGTLLRSSGGGVNSSQSSFGGRLTAGKQLSSTFLVDEVLRLTSSQLVSSCIKMARDLDDFRQHIDEDRQQTAELIRSGEESTSHSSSSLLADKYNDRGNGISPRKLADQRHHPARFPHAKIRSDPAGIEPESLWWEASRLTAQPQWLHDYLVIRGSGSAVARTLASHRGDAGPIPAGLTPGPSLVGIVLDDVTCRPGTPAFPPPPISLPPHPRAPPSPLPTRRASLGGVECGIERKENRKFMGNEANNNCLWEVLLRDEQGCSRLCDLPAAQPPIFIPSIFVLFSGEGQKERTKETGGKKDEARGRKSDGGNRKVRNVRRSERPITKDAAAHPDKLIADPQTLMFLHLSFRKVFVIAITFPRITWIAENVLDGTYPKYKYHVRASEE
ncbi:hypothetical protein PR048_010245 [Dryococelus australis]|uniref:Uncharacterized protein n=1 Tax=Dryococelus australis TaxID=614101 RepID=A0ABQ9I315_9NEOP|nr:hypothetical protein PR048_010245 [Dryococelus australis]